MTTMSGRFSSKQAAIDENTAASHEIVPAAPGRSIRVVSLFLVPDAAVAITFENASGTDLTGPMTLSEPLMLGFEDGLFWTAPGEALHMLLGGAVQVSGFVIWIEV